MSKYFPSGEKLTQETIATLAAIIISAFIISRIPALKKLIRDSNT